MSDFQGSEGVKTDNGPPFGTYNSSIRLGFVNSAIGLIVWLAHALLTGSFLILPWLTLIVTLILCSPVAAWVVFEKVDWGRRWLPLYRAVRFGAFLGVILANLFILDEPPLLRQTQPIHLILAGFSACIFGLIAFALTGLYYLLRDRKSSRSALSPR